jgi:hypothetical protein
MAPSRQTSSGTASVRDEEVEDDESKVGMTAVVDYFRTSNSPGELPQRGGVRMNEYLTSPCPQCNSPTPTPTNSPTHPLSYHSPPRLYYLGIFLPPLLSLLLRGWLADAAALLCCRDGCGCVGLLGSFPCSGVGGSGHTIAVLLWGGA